jgi:hypothetical protein
MKRFLIFSVSLLFSLQLQAQWNVYDSGKEYQVLVSTAQGQTAIYKNVPCEVKLVSLKNKSLKLTSSNATVTPNAEPGSYSIQTSDENAILQIYSVKKSKMKLLKEIQIRTVDVPLLDELTLSGNSLSVGYSYGMQFNSGESSPYDQQVFSKNYSVESWAFSCPAARKNLYGSGNQLSQNVTSFLRYLPEGVSYEIIAYHNGPINPGDYQPNVMQAFTSQNTEMPGAKYVVLNNTPANKAFFDPNDPNSLIGLVNNNYMTERTLMDFYERKTIPSDPKGNFLGSVREGIVSEDVRYFNEIDFVKYNLHENSVIDPNDRAKMVGPDDTVFYLQSSPVTNVSNPKVYLNTDSNGPYTLDPTDETIDKSKAKIDPGTGQPAPVWYTLKNLGMYYTSENIDNLIIRYDSIIDLYSGTIGIIPSKISFARKFDQNPLPFIVFSMKFKDLMSGDTSNLFAPTIHVKNDKSNASYFDLENSKSLLGYLNSKSIKELHISEFPILNGFGDDYFADDCDHKGKIDEKLVETETREIDFGKEKLVGYDSVYYKKGSGVKNVWEPIIYSNRDVNGPYTLDPKTETLDKLEAEIDPATGLPAPVYYKTAEILKSQYKGVTDLYIKRKYFYDPTFGLLVAKPTHLGFAQQMQGQTKPTLILQVGINSELLSMMPKINNSLFVSQPWVLSILQNDVEKQGEVIQANDIQTLQKKIQFRKKLVSLQGETELSNEPHF